MFELSDINAPTGQEIRFELKKLESNGIRDMWRNYEELVYQNPRGIKKVRVRKSPS